MLQTLTQDTTFEEPASVGGMSFDYGGGTWNGPIDESDPYGSLLGIGAEFGVALENRASVSPRLGSGFTINLVDTRAGLASALDETGVFELATNAVTGVGKRVRHFGGWAPKMITNPLTYSKEVQLGTPTQSQGVDHYVIPVGDAYTSTGTTSTFPKAHRADIDLMRKRVLNRIIVRQLVQKRVAELAAHLDDEGVGISQRSVDCLFSFFTRSLDVLERPAISATDNGTLRAVWRVGREQVALHFITDSKVNFVFFHFLEGQMIREYGEVPLAGVEDLIKQKNLGRLLKHDR